LPVRSTSFPYTTLFRSLHHLRGVAGEVPLEDLVDAARVRQRRVGRRAGVGRGAARPVAVRASRLGVPGAALLLLGRALLARRLVDRKSTRLNSSHVKTS